MSVSIDRPPLTVTKMGFSIVRITVLDDEATSHLERSSAKGLDAVHRGGSEFVFGSAWDRDRKTWFARFQSTIRNRYSSMIHELALK